MIKRFSDIIPEDSLNKLPPICDTSHAIELGSDKLTFQPGKIDSDIAKEITGQLERGIENFHIFTKIRDKNRKMIVNSGSCINAISSKVTKNFGLKALPHPHPNKMSWINSTALKVK